MEIFQKAIQLIPNNTYFKYTDKFYKGKEQSVLENTERNVFGQQTQYIKQKNVYMGMAKT